MKYRKKPVVIEAIQTREVMANALSGYEPVPPWLVSAVESGDVVLADNGLEIKTLEGVMKAGPEDYVIQGVKGEIYPCKPDIFLATYEPVLEP